MSGPDWERFGLVDLIETSTTERIAAYAAAMYGDDHDPLDLEALSTVLGQIEHDIARGVSTYGGLTS